MRINIENCFHIQCMSPNMTSNWYPCDLGIYSGTILTFRSSGDTCRMISYFDSTHPSLINLSSWIHRWLILDSLILMESRASSPVLSWKIVELGQIAHELNCSYALGRYKGHHKGAQGIKIFRETRTSWQETRFLSSGLRPCPLKTYEKRNGYLEQHV